MRFARQLGVVLKTYLTRPAFIIIVILGLASLTAMYIVNSEGYQVAFNVALFLGTVLLNLLPFTMLLLFIVMFFVHVRQQLRGPLAILTPDYRNAHLVVAATIFFAIAIAISMSCYHHSYSPNGMSNPYYDVLSFPGVFILVLTLMTFAALAGLGSLWWLLVFPLILIAMTRQQFVNLLHLWIYDSHIYLGHPYFIRASAHLKSILLSYLATEIWITRIERTVALLFDITALALLAWRARPLTRPPWEWRVIDKAIAIIRSYRKPPQRQVIFAAHRLSATLLKRCWHRRFAVHSPHLAWQMAAILCGFCLIIAFSYGRDPWHMTTILQPLVLATVLPGGIVAAGWRERWPSFGYESLLPCGRQRFALEMSIAMALDLAEFWVACWLGALVPLLIWEPRILLSSQLLLTVTASALMQVLFFGGTLLAARWRTGIVFGAIMLTLLMLAILVPLVEAWSQQPSLKPIGLLIVALVETAIGLVLAILGHAAWRRGELA